ncbi:liprin-beta-1-like [Lemur catta]|uniref:liprin-beta-1-like n=1 Tax=Lemur catta TaxID=9447 RepID=UPI001E2667A2|nr:liprin-beta-1-like [Lemur catta]
MTTSLFFSGLGWNLLFTYKKMSDESDMLASAPEKMNGIGAGSLRALHLVEDLRGLLEGMETEEKEGLRCQIPDSTAEVLVEWLQSPMTNGRLPGNGDAYQERLARLENENESFVRQASDFKVLIFPHNIPIKTIFNWDGKFKCLQPPDWSRQQVRQGMVRPGAAQGRVDAV